MTPNGCIHVSLPRGPGLFYNDEQHSYWICKEDGSRGKRIPSVSSLVKPLDFDPGKLMNWAARKNGEGISILAADGLSLDDPEDMRSALSFLGSADGIWSALQEAKLTYNDLRDAKGEIGTNVHTALEELCAGDRPEPTEYPPQEQGYVRALCQWWEDNWPDVLQSEQVVYSPTHGFCGRFDLRARIRGEVVLCDLKTSGYISPAYLAQLGGYALAAEECGVGAVERMFVLRVLEDGTYREIPAPPGAREDFLSALNVYRRARSLQALLKATS